MTTPVRPRLVLVTGAPGSGKTTLAHRLAERTGLPVLTKDAIKERMAEVLGVESIAQSQQLGRAAFGVLWQTVATLLQAGISLIVEANAQGEVAEREVRPLTAIADTVLLYCSLDRDVAVARYTARVLDPDRHWSHRDAERVHEMHRPEIAASWDASRPLDIGVPVLLVDTTDGYHPSLDDIVAFTGVAAS